MNKGKIYLFLCFFVLNSMCMVLWGDGVFY